MTPSSVGVNSVLLFLLLLFPQQQRVAGVVRTFVDDRLITHTWDDADGPARIIADGHTAVSLLHFGT